MTCLEEQGIERIEALLHLLNKEGEDEIDFEELLEGKDEEQVQTLADDIAQSVIKELKPEPPNDDDENDEGETIFTFTLDTESDSEEEQYSVEGKYNSFLQASICIYLAVAGDGYVNDEEIEGLISVTESLTNLYEFDDEQDPVSIAVEAQRIVDAEFEDYEPIPMELILRYARKVAKKITDEHLQKVVALLGLVAADADDDLDDNEISVLNTFIDEWDTSWDEVREIEGTF